MEWDQITDRWVAMTKRLRNDSLAGPRTIDRLKTTSRTTGIAERAPTDTMLPEIAGDDRSPTSIE